MKYIPSFDEFVNESTLNENMLTTGANGNKIMVSTGDKIVIKSGEIPLISKVNNGGNISIRQYEQKISDSTVIEFLGKIKFSFPGPNRTTRTIDVMKFKIVSTSDSSFRADQEIFVSLGRSLRVEFEKIS